MTHVKKGGVRLPQSPSIPVLEGPKSVCIFPISRSEIGFREP